MRTLTTLDDDDARLAIETIRTELKKRGKIAVMAVADAHGETLCVLRMSGAALSSTTIAQSKAFTAARLRRPTRTIGRNARHPETGFDMAYYGDPRYVGWGGGVPVTLGGAVVGAVAVSGLNQDEDEELAAMGAAAILAAAGEKT
jgi:glc operon protein GlcG